MAKAFFKIIIIISTIVKLISTTNINKKLKLGESRITIKIEYNNSQQILSKDYKGIKPIKINIGDVDQNLSDENSFLFVWPNNTIIIVWEDILNSTENMFKECSNITEIILNDFNASMVCNSKNMFSGCSKIKYLNLSTFKPISINNMENMFYGCSSLITLDISNFNLSKISKVNEILSDFYNLEYLNLINTSMNDYLFLDFLKIYFLVNAQKK